MPKKLKVSPNERVDIPDFLRGSNEYTAETAAFEAQKLLLGDRAHLIEGFRVRVVNSAGNPARVLVYNGNAKNVDGTHLHNEADPAYVQEVSITGAGTTFYIEVIFLEVDDDEDSRAFWDPTVDNTAPVPDGQEFDAPVITRTTPTWRIVNPVSTTGFEYDALTNPDSVKIPLVALTTNATNEVLTGGTNPGLEVVYPASVTELDFTATDTKLKVPDARLFSDVGGSNQITIDPDGVTTTGTTLTTVSGVDLANNILTIPLLGVTFPAGTVVRATGLTDEYIRERSAGLVPDDAATAGHPDNASRLFQGSETRGSGIQVDKEDATERSDLNLRNHKDQIDFLAAQLREIKWGASRVGDDGVEASRVPPTTFDLVNNSPRYYDKTRSIQGAGSYSYTVGDGVGSYGDFNAADETAINAAVQAASDGDTIFIKAGTYTLVNDIIVDKSLTFIGDGFNTAIVTLTAGVTCFAVSGAEQLAFRDMFINANNNIAAAVVVSDATTVNLTVDDCIMLGRIDPGTGSMLLYRVANCAVATAVAGSLLLGNAAGINAFRVVIEDNLLTTGAEDCTVVSFLSVENFSWQNNLWQDAGSATLGGVGVELLAARAVNTGQIRNTYVLGNAVTCPRLVFSAAGFGADNLVIDGVHVEEPGVLDSDSGETLLGFIKVDTFVNLEIRNVFVASDLETLAAKQISTFFLVLGTQYTASSSTAAPKNCLLENITIDYQISTTPGYGMVVGNLLPTSIKQNTTLRNVHVTNAVTAGQFQTVGTTVFEQCSVDGGGLNSGAHTGYVMINQGPLTSDRTDWAFRDCSFENIKYTNASTIRGILISGVTFNPMSLAVENCYFSTFGDASAAVTNTVFGVYAVSGNLDKLSVANNTFYNMHGPGSCGIDPVLITCEATSGLSQYSVVNNDIFTIGSGSNICNGIGFDPGVGTGATLSNVTIKDNAISTMATSSPGNYGIIVRTAAGTISNLNISDNMCTGISNALPSLFGGAVAVQAGNVTGLKIDNNQCYFSGAGGVGVPISLSLVEPTTGGTADSVQITNNTMTSFTGNETTAGVVVLGIAGSVVGTFSTFTHMSVSNNYVEVNHDSGVVQNAVYIEGYLQHCTFNDNTMRHLNPGTASVMLTVEGVDVDESEFITMRGNKLEMPTFSSANNMANIAIRNLKYFTFNDNIIDVDNDNAGFGVVLQYTACNNGTITGNVIRSPNINTKTIEFLGGSNFFIYGTGNNFGGGTNPNIVGTSAPSSIVMTEGAAAAVGAVASNLTL